MLVLVMLIVLSVNDIGVYVTLAKFMFVILLLAISIVELSK